jgi:hypothetical protein
MAQNGQTTAPSGMSLEQWGQSMASVRSHIGNPGETARGIAADTPDGHTMHVREIEIVV